MAYDENFSNDEFTPYERRVRTEIERWRDEKDGRLTKALSVIGAPVEWGYEKVPKDARQTLESAIMGFMEMLKDGS